MYREWSDLSWRERVVLTVLMFGVALVLSLDGVQW